MQKYLAEGHGLQTEHSEVRVPWQRAKYFPIQPSHLVNKYFIMTNLETNLLEVLTCEDIGFCFSAFSAPLAQMHMALIQDFH